MKNACEKEFGKSNKERLRTIVTKICKSAPLERTNKRAEGRPTDQTHEKTDQQMDQQTHEQTEQQTDQPTDGWMDKGKNVGRKEGNCSLYE